MKPIKNRDIPASYVSLPAGFQCFGLACWSLGAPYFPDMLINLLGDFGTNKLNIIVDLL